MIPRCLILAWLMTLPCDAAGGAEGPAAVPLRGQRWALLVGVNDYAELSSLQYCRRDIERLRERLIEIGFPADNVTVLHDGRRESLYQPFRASIAHHFVAMLRAAGPEDLILFAFSGHGMELDGASFLCPVDARLDANPSSLIPLDVIYRGMQLSEARQKILLVDACRNDPRPGGERSIEHVADVNTAFARSLEEPPEGIVVLSSCKPGEISFEDDKMGHGVFLHFVIEGLRGEADRVGGNNDGKVSLFELYRYASTRTRAFVARSRDTIQTPVLRGELTADFELGDVVHRDREVRQAWTLIREEADALFEENAVLKWLQQLYRRQSPVEAAREEFARWNAAIGRLLRRPEAIVLSNPSLIATQHPETLLAIQRAYAFGIRGDADGVLAAATEAIEIEPDNPFPYLLRAMAHAEKASRLQMVRRMITVSGNPRILAQMVLSAGRDSFIARQFQEILRELNAASPELAVDLELARTDPDTFTKAITQTLAELEAASPLTMAIQDYERIGIGLPCFLDDGAQLRSGQQVVGRVKGYTRLFQITQVNGPLLLAEEVGQDQGLKGWVRHEDLSNLIPFFQVFQMIPDQGF